MKTMTSRRLNAAGLLLIGIAIGIAGCKKASPPGTEAQVKSKPTQKVRCVLAQKKAVIDYVEFVGRTKAFARVEARSRVSGFLTKIHFEDSQMVKKGDLLFTIEQDQYKAAYDQSLAEVDVWKAKVQLARSNAARSKSLVAQKATSAQEYESQLAALAEAKASLIAAEAEAIRNRLNVDYTEIRSPIDGQIDQSLVDEGNFVTGGALGGTILTTIVTIDPIRAYGAVNEGVVLQFMRRERENRSKGGEFVQQELISDLKLPVFLQLEDEDQFPHEGQLDYAQNEVDKTTGTSTVRGVFKNADGLLKPGMFVRMRVPVTDEYEAVVVPDRAVGTDQATRFVYVVDSNGLVKERQVEVGDLKGKGIRVIKSGLKPGEKVVVAGLSLIKSGMTVNASMESFDAEETRGKTDPTADSGSAAETGSSDTSNTPSDAG